MSEIDWSKAPEGYPIWIEDLKPGICGDIGGWHREESDRYVDAKGEFWSKPECGFYRVYRNPNESWTGQGLPPAGTVCEMQHSVSGIDSDWVMVKINYCSPHNTVATSIDGGIEFLAFTRRSQFRPIRTQAQIEAEEREKAIDAICYDICLHYGNPKGSEHYLNLATKLHDLGYRKQGEAK